MGTNTQNKKQSKKMKLQVALASLTALATANVLEDLTESRDTAAKVLRSKRALGRIDPDEWCRGDLKHPRCWEDFTELVWQPLRINNAVSREEGRKLYWC